MLSVVIVSVAAIAARLTLVPGVIAR